MGAAYFYHLTRRPLEATLPVLLTRARQAGWRIAVRGTDAARMIWLDERLWLGPDDEFPAHGLVGGAHDARQPILLGVIPAANSPDCVMCVDGADIDPEEVTALARVCVLFDGNDDVAVQSARRQWKTLATAGCSAKYWSEASGRWEMKAETGG
jgi:DNA polymerase III subunit chi